MDLHQRIDHNMTNHTPSPEDIELIEELRWAAKNFAHVLVDLCPESRELDLALTDAEDALMHGVAAIARQVPDGGVV